MTTNDSQWEIREEQPTQAYSFLRGSFHCFGRTFVEPLGIRYNIYPHCPRTLCEDRAVLKKEEI